MCRSGEIQLLEELAAPNGSIPCLREQAELSCKKQGRVVFCASPAAELLQLARDGVTAQGIVFFAGRSAPLLVGFCMVLLTCGSRALTADGAAAVGQYQPGGSELPSWTGTKFPTCL